MNEDLNLAETLKDCPKGTKLYSTIFGDVELVEVSQREDIAYPIEFKKSNRIPSYYLTKDGRVYKDLDGDCTLFPSKDQRDWSKFEIKKPKFDPKTLQPFDKVLVRDNEEGRWVCSFYSHYREYGETLYRYMSTNNAYRYCIPYNEDTKHLVGTAEEAPEFYRYWEE